MDEPPGGPPRRHRFLQPACVSQLDSTRPVSRAVRQGPSPRPPSPQEEWTRRSPATPQVLPGQGRTREAAAEHNHRARTCNFCSVTEDFLCRETRSLPSRAAIPGGQSPGPLPVGARGHVGATSAAYCRARLLWSSWTPVSFPRAANCRLALCSCGPRSTVREWSARFPRKSQEQFRHYSGWN